MGHDNSRATARLAKVQLMTKARAVYHKMLSEHSPVILVRKLIEGYS